MKALNYGETFSKKTDDELIELVQQFHSLTEAAQIALKTETEKRKLQVDFPSTVQPMSKPSEPGGAEKVMFFLLVGSAVFLPLSYLIQPYVTKLGSLVYGLFEMAEGISYMFLLWLIIWLVLRGKRLQRS